MDTRSLAKLFRDIPTGGHAVDSKIVAESGKGRWCGGGANRCILNQGSVLPSCLRLTKLLWNCEEIFKIIPKRTDVLQNWHQNTLIQHIYISKLVIFDINAFSIHVNNTDVTKAAWCWSLIPASPLWSGSQTKTCIFRGGIQAGTAVKWPWQR